MRTKAEPTDYTTTLNSQPRTRLRALISTYNAVETAPVRDDFEFDLLSSCSRVQSLTGPLIIYHHVIYERLVDSAADDDDDDFFRRHNVFDRTCLCMYGCVYVCMYMLYYRKKLLTPPSYRMRTMRTVRATRGEVQGFRDRLSNVTRCVV